MTEVPLEGRVTSYQGTKLYIICRLGIKRHACGEVGRRINSLVAK